MAGNHHDNSDHKPGSMDIRVQEKTFAGFIRMVTWGIGISIGLLIFTALVNG
jgi:Bacterial aa3 type cytochrome c oxidase subunit IV